MTLEAEASHAGISIRWSQYIGDEAVDTWRITASRGELIDPPGEIFVRRGQLSITIPHSSNLDTVGLTHFLVEPILLSEPDRGFPRLARGFMLDDNTVLPWRPLEGSDEKDFAALSDLPQEASSIVSPALSIEFVDARSVVIHTPTTPWEAGPQRLLRWGLADHFARSEPNNDTLLPGSVATPGRVSIGGLRPGGEYAAALFEGDAESSASDETIWRMPLLEDELEDQREADTADLARELFESLPVSDRPPPVNRRPEPVEVEKIAGDLEELLLNVQQRLHQGVWERRPDIELDVQSALGSLRGELYPPVDRPPNVAVLGVLAARLSKYLLEEEQATASPEQETEIETLAELVQSFENMDGRDSDGDRAIDAAAILADQIVLPSVRPEGLDVSESVWRQALTDIYEQRLQFLFWKLRWRLKRPQLTRATEKVLKALDAEHERHGVIAGGAGMIFAFLSSGSIGTVPGILAGRFTLDVSRAILGWAVRLLRSGYQSSNEDQDADGDPVGDGVDDEELG